MPLIAMAPQNQVALIGLVVFALVCAITGFVLMGRFPTQRQVLDKWARRHNLQIAEAHRRTCFYGLFRLPRSTAQAIFRITVRDSAGELRKGIARVGGFFGLGDHVKVAWDRDPESDVDVPDVDDVQ